ncbi:MAG: leucine-rich repeat domain-containing protein, partial [Prochloraceae cyanobacterium]
MLSFNYFKSNRITGKDNSESESIKELDLSVVCSITYPKVSIIDDNIYKLTNLESLNLRNNALISIPRKIAKLKNLKILNLLDNKSIGYLDLYHVSRLPSLEYLL